MSGDEGDTETEIRRKSSMPKVHDFEPGSTIAISPDGGSIISGRKKEKKKKKRSKRFGRKSKPEETEDVAPVPATLVLPSDVRPVVSPLQNLRSPRVGFADQTQNPDSPAAKGKSFRPALPKLLSQNVFVSPPTNDLYQTATLSRVPSTPGNRPRRASSLPDLKKAELVNPVRRSGPYPYRGRISTPVETEGEPVEEDGELEMSRSAAVVMLLISTALVAVCAEFLVDAIPDMVENSSVSQAFIGLIILPIVGNAAEHVTAVTVAAKNKMDLAIGVSVGSSIQIGKHSVARCFVPITNMIQRYSSLLSLSFSDGA
jgi:Ca2+:H+ antiporter